MKNGWKMKDHLQEHSFTCVEFNDEKHFQFVLCLTVECMLPSKLQRHLGMLHPNVIKDLSFKKQNTILTVTPSWLLKSCFISLPNLESPIQL